MVSKSREIIVSLWFCEAKKGLEEGVCDLRLEFVGEIAEIAYGGKM